MAAALDLPIQAGFAGTDSHQDEPCAARVTEIPSGTVLKFPGLERSRQVDSAQVLVSMRVERNYSDHRFH
jgi:hypothetical protein